MLGFKRRKKKKVGRIDRYIDRYDSLDIESMSDEEFELISSKIYKEMAIRGILGIAVFIVGVILLVLGGRYLW